MIRNNQKIEKFRVRRGKMGSDASYGNNGAFEVTCPETKRRLFIIASDGQGWDHVSVHVKNRLNDTPKWEEMCYVKDLFFEPDEWVIQYHPARSAYVNCHPGTLHLWRPLNEEIPIPPKNLI